VVTIVKLTTFGTGKALRIDRIGG